jgi:leucyl aminopeptidase
MPADAVLTPLTTHLCAIDALPDAAEQVGTALVVVLGPDQGDAAAADAWAAALRRRSGDEPVLVSQESGAAGERCVYAVPAAGTTDEARRIGARVGRLGTTLDMHAEVVVAHELLSDPRRTEAFVEGLVLGGYQPTHVSRPAGTTARAAASATVVHRPAQPAARTCLVTEVDETVLERAVVTAVASLVARNLANAPANVATPEWLAERAQEVAGRSGLEISVRDEEALAAEGFGGLTAVGGGSVNPPRLVELAYRPKGAKGGCRTSSSSARASPSTPGGSASSRPRRCRRCART